MPTSSDPRLSLRLSRDDHAELVKAARKARMPVGPFVTAMALKAVRAGLEPREKRVRRSQAVRLDHWIAERSGVPEAVARRWIKAGLVFVDGSRCRVVDCQPWRIKGGVVVDGVRVG